MLLDLRFRCRACLNLSRILKFEVKLLARDRKPIEAALWRLQSTLKELVGAEAQDLLWGMEESIG